MGSKPLFNRYTIIGGLTITALLFFLAFSIVRFGGSEAKLQKGTEGLAPNQRTQVIHDRRAILDSATIAEDFRDSLLRLARTIKDPMAREIALKRMGDNNYTIREACAEALTFFEDPESLNALKSMLKDREPLVQQKAAQSISLLSGTDTDLMNFLKSSISEKEIPGVTAFAIFHLANVEPKALKDNLASLITHKDWKVRLAAVRALKLVCPADLANLHQSISKNETMQAVLDALESLETIEQSCKVSGQ